LQLRKVLIEKRNGLDALQVVPDPEMFVGGMYGIAVQSKAHQDGLALQLFLEQGNNGNTSAAALWNGGFPESFLIRIIGSLIFDGVDGGDVSLPAVVRLDHDLYALRRQAFEVFFEQLGDLFPV